MDGKGYLIEFDYNNGGNSKLIYLPIPKQLAGDIGIEGRLQIQVHKILDWNKLLKVLYPDYKIIDCQGMGGGHPDFTLTNKKDTIYLECKQGNDSLRYTQMEWIFNAVRSGKKVKVIFFRNDDIPNQNEEMGKRMDGGNQNESIPI